MFCDYNSNICILQRIWKIQKVSKQNYKLPALLFIASNAHFNSVTTFLVSLTSLLILTTPAPCLRSVSFCPPSLWPASSSQGLDLLPSGSCTFRSVSFRWTFFFFYSTACFPLGRKEWEHRGSELVLEHDCLVWIPALVFLSIVILATSFEIISVLNCRMDIIQLFTRVFQKMNWVHTWTSFSILSESANSYCGSVLSFFSIIP